MTEPVFTLPPPQPQVPQAGPPVYELSGWWRRVGATLLDGFIIWVTAVILMAILGVGGGFTTDPADDPLRNLNNSATDQTSSAYTGFNFDGWGILIFFLMSVLLGTAVMAATNGKTIGMMATGIRVVREGGEQIGFGFAFYRENIIKGFVFGWLAIFTLYIATFLNYLWPLWDDKNQALHDKICKTRVVLDNGSGEAATFAMAPPVPATPAPPTYTPAPSGPPAPPMPPAPPTTPGTYQPPPGFDNPVPDDK